VKAGIGRLPNHNETLR